MTTVLPRLTDALADRYRLEGAAESRGSAGVAEATQGSLRPTETWASGTKTEGHFSDISRAVASATRSGQRWKAGAL